MLHNALLQVYVSCNTRFITLQQSTSAFLNHHSQRHHCYRDHFIAPHTVVVPNPDTSPSLRKTHYGSIAVTMDAKPLIQTRETAASLTLKQQATHTNVLAVPPGLGGLQHFEQDLDDLWNLRQSLMQEYVQTRGIRRIQAQYYEEYAATGTANEDTECDVLRVGCRNVGELIKSLAEMDDEVLMLELRIDDLSRRFKEILDVGYVQAIELRRSE